VTTTYILLVAEDGVMVAENPVTSAKVVLDIVKVSVLVVDTTCITLPDGNTAPADKSRLDPEATSITKLLAAKPFKDPTASSLITPHSKHYPQEP
jgi:hypothetical protein